jgi:methylmalonyl-CoA/ethylmalonyl-CoA epimerase
MLNKINHIGIAVRSLSQRADYFQTVFNLPEPEIKNVPSQKVKVAAYEIGGIKLEFLEATSPESPVAKFIEKKGEGLHHIGFEVPDIIQALTELKGQGVEVIDSQPRLGAFGDKVAFLHPQNFGILVELVEPADYRQ